MSNLISEFLQWSSYANVETVIFVVIALASYWGWKSYRRPVNLPPGPRGLPILGYLPFIEEKSHVQFNELAKTYGDIFSIYLGNKLVIVLNSYETIKDAFIKQSDIFAGRNFREVSRAPSTPGIFASEGEIFKDYKRFTLSTLRNFGLGKLSLEPQIKEEIDYLVEMIKTYKGQPTNIGNLLRMSISNVICTMKFGQRYDYKDSEFLHMMEVLTEYLSRAQPIDFRLFFPVFTKIPGLRWLLYKTSLGSTANTMLQYIKKKIDLIGHTHENGDESNFISAWLTEASRRGKENGKNFTNEHLARVVFSLFIAGSDTTSNTLRWGLLYLMKYPDIQTRIQEEIDDVIGHERQPSITDKDNMPYTEAVIMEINRICSLVPLAIVHANTEATKLKGFDIPKRCFVYPNLWAVHHDPKTFPEPECFRPERFLDTNGKLVKSENLIPFSLGKRQCLGEGLARMELFLYFTSLLQNFTFCKPEGDALSFEYDMGTVAIPKPFKVKAIVRSANEKK